MIFNDKLRIITCNSLFLRNYTIYVFYQQFRRDSDEKNQWYKDKN